MGPSEKLSRGGVRRGEVNPRKRLRAGQAPTEVLETFESLTRPVPSAWGSDAGTPPMSPRLGYSPNGFGGPARDPAPFLACPPRCQLPFHVDTYSLQS